jgi:hypothetical protein
MVVKLIAASLSQLLRRSSTLPSFKHGIWSCRCAGAKQAGGAQPTSIARSGPLTYWADTLHEAVRRNHHRDGQAGPFLTAQFSDTGKTVTVSISSALFKSLIPKEILAERVEVESKMGSDEMT